FDAELVAKIPSAASLEKIRQLSKTQVYAARSVVEIEAAGFEVLGGLLEFFVAALFDASAKGKDASARSKKYMQLLPQVVQQCLTNPKSKNYERIMRVTD